MLCLQLKEKLALAGINDEMPVIRWLLKRNPGIDREPISSAFFASLTDDYKEANQGGFICYTKGELPWFFIRKDNQVLLMSILITPVKLYELVEQN